MTVGFIFFKKIRKTYWQWFPVYLSVIVAFEYINAFFREIRFHYFAEVFFNYLGIPIEFLFLFWIFSQAFRNTKSSSLPLICGLIYLLCWFADILYMNKIHFIFTSASYTVGNLLLLILILRFFIRLANDDSILTFRQNMLFWFCLGMLLFYLGSFPYYGLRNTLAHSYKDLCSSYSNIVLVLDSLMYIMFTIGFIWGKPNSKSF